MNEIKEFKAGDVIEARRGDTVIRGTANPDKPSNVYALVLVVPELGWEGRSAKYLTWLHAKGWTLTIVERAEPAFKDGVYLPSSQYAERYARNGYLPNLWVHVRGEWWSIPNLWHDGGAAPYRLYGNVSGAVRLVVE
jgi:hypothetical protein